jgi:hypothetical protein
MTWRRHWSESDDGGRVVGLPLALAPSGIGSVLGFVGALFGGGKNVGLRAPLLYGVVQRVAHNHEWLAPLIRARD